MNEKQKMHINWFPGHMKKTLDNLKKSLKEVDIVLEIVDSRIPISSRNPILDDIIGDKPRIILLNKADLSNDRENQRWKSYLENINTGVLLINALNGRGLKELRATAESLLEEKFKKIEKRGMIDKTIKMMIVGIPNVGKSTLINTLANRKGALVGNKPGVTKKNQLINTGNDMELLDTPGVLWHKFEEDQGLNLAFTGAIKDEILDTENLVYRLIEKLMTIDPDILFNRYKLEIDEESMEYQMNQVLYIMEEIGRKRGCLIKGGEIDYDKVSNIILNEFRSGSLGKISLETIDEVRR